MKFRKKPVVIEAVQFTDANGHAMRQFVGKDWSWNPLKYEGRIQTLEGEMVATVGDWIIRGVKGEFYPCKPDIFAATYTAEDE